MNQPNSNEIPAPIDPIDTPVQENVIEKPRPRLTFRRRLRKYWAILALFTYVIGLGSGYFLRDFMPNQKESEATAAAPSSESASQAEIASLMKQVNPPEGFQLPVKYGDIGPKLIQARAFDPKLFIQLYQDTSRPLSQEQVDILTRGSSQPVVITSANAQFLLNLFWALGLTNQNQVLTEGPMMEQGKDKVTSFASTGGWTLAAKPVAELYASASIVPLTTEQQKRMDEVAGGVYRPCCDNPTHFPDCNHGMAMLGLLELMASQGATTDQMFDAAKDVNAFWFPQQTLELAVALKTIKNIEFVKADAKGVVGPQFSSGSGAQAVHQYLVQNGQLKQGSSSGGSCGVK